MRKNVRNLLLQGLAAVLLAGGTLGAVNATGDEANASTKPGPRTGSHATSLRAVWPALKTGSRGTDVLTAQHLLAARGHRLAADGAFGQKTTKAVRDFQRKNRLKADGVIGAKTWAKLTNLTVASGARGQAVKAVQVQLGVKADGVFGRKTKAAVSSFQKKSRLAVDGVVRPTTWHRLIAGTSTLAVPASPRDVRLDHKLALRQLAAAGIQRPVGRTSLHGVRARTIQGVIALRKASRCTIVITGGTESGHSTKGNYSHAKGYKLDLRTRDEGRCVTNWIKNTQRKGKPRGNDPRWHGTLNGISAEYVYETPRNGGIHWDITFK
ncbi:peptidoglycan-binding protein [Streptomyces sp. NBC_00572]|uniref:peptidoglycan-binding domain-containing protein n=1 Tax=Streptomyces sp. NBC_00572 TaxID=2903664 RepID=UPI002251E100|nr:peptidoglycan-binding protein [Streptomyces sp. NBC_00572]MCX4987032.1 peptidoglycan-binding protein [Streptomyces sp. NBC_00572]